MMADGFGQRICQYFVITKKLYFTNIHLSKGFRYLNSFCLPFPVLPSSVLFLPFPFSLTFLLFPSSYLLIPPVLSFLFSYICSSQTSSTKQENTKLLNIILNCHLFTGFTMSLQCTRVLAGINPDPFVQAVLDDNVTGVCEALDGLRQTILQMQEFFVRVHGVFTLYININF